MKVPSFLYQCVINTLQQVREQKRPADYWNTSYEPYRVEWRPGRSILENQQEDDFLKWAMPYIQSRKTIPEIIEFACIPWGSRVRAYNVIRNYKFR